MSNHLKKLKDVRNQLDEYKNEYEITYCEYCKEKKIGNRC